MQYVKLGRTGLDVSRICLGCMSYGEAARGGHPWALDEETSRPFYVQALDAGINFFDTANAYGDGASESAWGEILSDYPRADYILATKVFFPVPGGQGLSAEQIHKQIDASLGRLQTDYVDLYQ
jgi:aryl-alcohol dehydrogenase-like predicted oxidoreductase